MEPPYGTMNALFRYHLSSPTATLTACDETGVSFDIPHDWGYVHDPFMPGPYKLTGTTNALDMHETLGKIELEKDIQHCMIIGYCTVF
uniref:Uncharacterized protein n=1 Tax=Moniliophthora roreri TaxID=221103 RepID=A0A0W0GE40_MONRR